MYEMKIKIRTRNLDYDFNGNTLIRIYIINNNKIITIIIKRYVDLCLPLEIILEMDHQNVSRF